MLETFHNIADFFRGVPLQDLAGNIKAIFTVLTVLFLGLAVFSYIKAHLLVKAHRAHDTATAHHGTHHEAHGEDMTTPQDADALAAYQRYWDWIKSQAQSFRDSEWKLAVIEADKLVDDTLKAHGYPGETMGERLMLIKPEQFLSLQDLWDAHKLRNIIVHDTQYRVTQEQALAAVNAYERTLRELGLLH